jgi:hypothetical protein
MVIKSFIGGYMGRNAIGDRSNVFIKLKTTSWEKYQEIKKNLGLIPRVQLEKDIDKMLEEKNGK